MNVKKRYDKHIANFYSRMVGDLSSKSNEFNGFILENGIRPTETKAALDLGAGK